MRLAALPLPPADDWLLALADERSDALARLKLIEAAEPLGLASDGLTQAQQEVDVLTAAMATISATTVAEIKLKLGALGPAPITARLLASLSPIERALAASALRDVLALG
jgi:hypothetical protein